MVLQPMLEEIANLKKKIKCLKYEISELGACDNFEYDEYDIAKSYLEEKLDRKIQRLIQLESKCLLKN